MPDPSSSPTDIFLSVRDLVVEVSGRPVLTLPALELPGGSLLHLTGENGAGKTTLLRALAGELAYRGDVRVGGAVPGSLEAKAQTTYVPTDAGLLEDLTVAEFLTFTARAWHRDEAEAFALAAADGLPLGDAVAAAAWEVAAQVLRPGRTELETVVFDRGGDLVGRAHFAPVHAASPDRNLRL